MLLPHSARPPTHQLPIEPMGKFVISSCGKQQQQQRSSSSSSLAAAGGYLTLRSGRRVPAAAACGLRSKSHCQGSPGRRCSAKSSHCSPRRKGAAGVRQRCRVVNSPLLSGGGRPEQEEEAPAKESNTVVRDDGSGYSRRDKKLPSGEPLKQQHQADGFAGRPTRSPPEAEVEAFLAAAELAERRRFAETYNYDVALDRPLEGRFEWEHVSKCKGSLELLG